jgi:large subunit ribosomal protein L18
MIAPKKRMLIVPHRRKREGRTDYQQRLRLLKSGIDRFVVRASTNGITCQIIKYKKDGDATLVSANSSELAKHGWKACTSNLPAAYLTGLLCAIKAKKAGVSKAVMDIGTQKSSTGSRIYAALKGAVDGGLGIPHGDEAFPPADRVSGKHIADYAAKMKAEDHKLYEKTFSAYLKHNLIPEHVPQYFEKTKESIAK